MNTFARLELLTRGRKVTLYTVKLEQDDDTNVVSETEKFYAKCHGLPDYASDLEEINGQLAVIAARGLRQGTLRSENSAWTLPSKHRSLRSVGFIPNPDGPLRLYCVVVSSEVIILCNGGVKDANEAQNSDVISHFRLANQLDGLITDYLSYLPSSRTRADIEKAFETFDVKL